MNAAFYLGTGFYEGNSSFGSWTQINCDQSAEFQIINFGGWGCCPGDPGPCQAAKTSNSWCNGEAKVGEGTTNPDCLKISNLPSKFQPANGASTGPNCVWTDTEINLLPSLDDITARGYNGVSIDIEGARPGLTGETVDAKLSSWSGIKRIITVPGNGVADAHGGMDWFEKVASGGNLDYVCLMYYAAINDTECAVGIGCAGADASCKSGEENLYNSLTKYWSGPSSRFKLHPSQIILGFSFGKKDSPASYLSERVQKLASGGITRWAEKGGNFNWSGPGAACSGTPAAPTGGGGGNCNKWNGGWCSNSDDVAQCQKCGGSCTVGSGCTGVG